MSLDFYLISKKKIKKEKGSGIFIRKDGKNLEITREEWDKMYPDREPVTFKSDEEFTNELYSDNITHNLTEMADKAGIYYALWRPEEKGYKTAKDLIEPLEAGIKLLKEKPNYFKKFNPANDWGNYEGLVLFAEGCLNACKMNPEAEIQVSR